MRVRCVAALLGVAALALAAVASPALAAGPTLAQQQQEEDVPGEEESGQDAEAETDPGEGGGAAEETGPPWTYQMSWLALIGAFFLLLAIGAAYYRFVVTRQRGEA
ncbi:MAG: hypothetical protein ACRDJJ_07175 [Actinomycetota bacterium]